MNVVKIKFKECGKGYYFSVQTDVVLSKQDAVIVETVRGQEFAFVDEVPIPISEANVQFDLKPIVRIATTDDAKRHESNQALAIKARDIAGNCITKHSLEMYLTDCEYTFDRSKIIISYVADQRVDFRDLLKDLASNLKCRIELKQIGSRDKSKLVGGVGTCGEELCCSRFLSEFDGISINMAKNQGMALHSESISGQCGKLLCCLKYENEMYTEAKKEFPPINKFVMYHDKRCKVLGHNIISGLVKIDFAGSIQFVKLEDVEMPNGEN